MFYLKSEKKQIEPIVFLNIFHWRKMERMLQYGSQNASHACLLKYFPKYEKQLSLERKSLTRAVESKIKRLKVVRFCFECTSHSEDGKTYKKLFKTSRKTLKSIPLINDGYDSIQNFSLCAYFPNIKIINVEYNPCRFQKFYQQKLVDLDKFALRKLFNSFGYFWGSCRFVEILTLELSHELDLAIIKKIDNSKQFMSSLKTLYLTITPKYDSTETVTNLLTGLMKNKNLLRHATHLYIDEFSEKRPDRELLQLLIDCCPQLCSFSFIGDWDPWNASNQDLIKKDFCLNLSSLQNLRVLRLHVYHFRTFINGVQFPPYLREITLKISDHKESESLDEFFDRQKEREYDELSEDQDERFWLSLEKGQDSQDDISQEEDQDRRDWESFEKFRMLGEFFEKWRKLENLKNLNLKLEAFSDINTLARNFIIPLLRVIPNLETFDFDFLDQDSRISQGNSSSVDLEEFLSGMESLKHFKIQYF